MWIEPKTDWKITRDASGKYTGDYFQADDYNRIKGNMIYLHDLAADVYPPVPFEAMGGDKTYTDYPYAEELNRIEGNLESLLEGTYPFSENIRNVYYDNQSFLTVDDLNRIEKACLLLYRGLWAQKNGRRRLSYRMGTMKDPIKPRMNLGTRLPVRLKGE